MGRTTSSSISVKALLLRFLTTGSSIRTKGLLWAYVIFQMAEVLISKSLLHDIKVYDIPDSV